MVNWKRTVLSDADPDMRKEIVYVTHATNLEAAINVVKSGQIKAQSERQPSNALYNTHFRIVWLSPNDWDFHQGNVFGCVAFDFDFKRVLETYGDRQYALQEVVEGLPMSRIMLSNFNLKDVFSEYNPTEADIPWIQREGQHYYRKGCVFQVAVDTPTIPLFELGRMGFIEQKRGVKGKWRLHKDTVSRLFLARAVGEQIPKVPCFCGLDPATGQPFESLTFACRNLWYDLSNRVKAVGGLSHFGSPESKSLARAFLDRYSRLSALGPYRDEMIRDSECLGAFFHAKDDLLLCVRQVIADWAEIEEPALLNTDTWPI